MFARFWWGQRNSEQKMYWLSWQWMYTLKFKGGMGFKHLKLFDLAVLAKQVWGFMHNSEYPLYRVLGSIFIMLSFCALHWGGRLCVAKYISSQYSFET